MSTAGGSDSAINPPANDLDDSDDDEDGNDYDADIERARTEGIDINSIVTVAGLFEFAAQKGVDTFSIFLGDRPINELRADVLAAVTQLMAKDNDQNDAPETGPHAAPDDNDADKAAAMEEAQQARDNNRFDAEEANSMALDVPVIKEMKASIVYLAGLKCSQSEFAEFKQSFPGLF
jgi:hypothetical protein